MSGEPASESERTEPVPMVVRLVFTVVFTGMVGGGAFFAAGSQLLAAVSGPMAGIGVYLFIGHIHEFSAADEESIGGGQQVGGVNPFAAGAALIGGSMVIIGIMFVLENALYAIGGGLAISTMEFLGLSLIGFGE